jgi:hypothetical protein
MKTSNPTLYHSYNDLPPITANIKNMKSFISVLLLCFYDTMLRHRHKFKEGKGPLNMKYDNTQ